MKNTLIYHTDLLSNTKSCNDTEWTNFYTIDTVSKIFEELLIKLSNTHLLRISVDNSIILDESIQNLYDFYKDVKQSELDINIRCIKHGNEYFLSVKLGSIYGHDLKIDQKRISGTGNVTINGIIVMYKEVI